MRSLLAYCGALLPAILGCTILYQTAQWEDHVRKPFHRVHAAMQKVRNLRTLISLLAIYNDLVDNCPGTKTERILEERKKLNGAYNTLAIETEDPEWSLEAWPWNKPKPNPSPQPNLPKIDEFSIIKKILARLDYNGDELAKEAFILAAAYSQPWIKETLLWVAYGGFGVSLFLVATLVFSSLLRNNT